MKLIELESVTKFYNDKPAVKDFTLQIERKERLVVLGPSSCGKTTLLEVIGNFKAASCGQCKIGQASSRIEEKAAYSRNSSPYADGKLFSK